MQNNTKLRVGEKYIYQFLPNVYDFIIYYYSGSYAFMNSTFAKSAKLCEKIRVEIEGIHVDHGIIVAHIYSCNTNEKIYIYTSNNKAMNLCFDKDLDILWFDRKIIKYISEYNMKDNIDFNLYCNCNGPTITNSVLGKQFLFCTKCKKERL